MCRHPECYQLLILNAQMQCSNNNSKQDRYIKLIIVNFFRLTIEAARTWTTFLNYGLLTDQFVSYHPVLMRQLLFLKEEVSMNGVRDSSKFNFHFGSSILEVIRSAVCCLPTTADTFSAVDRAVAVSNSSHMEWSQFIGTYLYLFSKCTLFPPTPT